MLENFRSLWIPGAYHGRGEGKVFFEGWYLKLVNRDRSARWAVIPGVFHHPDPQQAHAFIQVLDGTASQVVYHRYPVEAFQASRSDFDLRVGSSRFSAERCLLDIHGQGQVIQGEITFRDLHPWPVNLFSPGVMGPYGLIPFMQTYHGVLSLDHSLEGSLVINGRQEEFTGGRGYMEKDWGKTFPRAYIWMQSNHFEKTGVSLTASVATIPWLGSWFRGFIIGLLLEERIFRFATYLGSKISRLSLTDSHVSWALEGKRESDPQGRFPGLRLEIQAERGKGGLLSSPELDGMTPRILESLTACVDVRLLALDGSGQAEEILFQGRGDCAGLEVAGSVADVLD